MLNSLQIVWRTGVFVVVCASLTPPAQAQQLGILTSVVGSGELDGEAQDWLVGSSIDVDSRLVTHENSYAMIFFVSGFIAREIEFDGTIVVQMDQNTEVVIKVGESRRKPIDVHVLRGRVLAHFDAGEHKEFILLSTPQGELRVTGSKIYVAHDPTTDESTLGTFDSPCLVTLYNDNKDEFRISDFEKVVVTNGQGRTSGMLAEDEESWRPVTRALSLESAFAYNNDVRADYVGATWVGGYFTGAEHLEDVGQDASANIPTQEPIVASTPSAALTRVAQPTPRQTQPALRASSGRRTSLDDEGVGRETLNRLRMRRLRR